MSIPSKFRWNFRLFVVCFCALAASLPMAWISLSKLLLFVTALALLLASLGRGMDTQVRLPARTTKVVLIALGAFGASLLWTEVDLDFALGMLVKHAKLLQIVLLVYLIRSAREASLAVKVFVCAQIFVLISSWLLAAGIALPWVRNDQTFVGARYVVFSESYLDQTLMLASLAALVWHLRSEWKWPHFVAAAIAVAALLDVLLLSQGRTGYIACLTVALMALLWSLSRRMRWLVLLLGPVLIAVAVLAGGNNRVSTRLSAVVHESQSYSQSGDTNSSSGWRLNAWRRSVQAIAIQPWTGYGVGSFAPVVKRLDGDKAVEDFGVGNSSNPHQEYLLWGVELGVLGSLLLVALFVALAMDARPYPTGIRRAAHSVIAVTAMACLFNSSLYDALIGDFLCTAIGLLMAWGMQRSDPDSPTPAPTAC